MTSLLDALDPTLPETGADTDAPDAGHGLSVRQMLDRVGSRSFGAALLVPALILVSPLSAIPLMPTLGGLVIVTIATQALFGTQQLWLPRFLSDRTLNADQLCRAIGFLRRPAKWLDAHSRNRLRLLTAPPLDRLALMAVIIVAATWPFLEILPMFTSVSAAGVALIAFALMVRDGFALIAGYIVLGASLAVVVGLIVGLL
ncbi:exopolysaccharide biosynthesis protein [Marivita sp. S2033]|uniref:exopolysaccharide biosynthesis protein n=1 Tax=Marivita sp. S2033 TaxID=3373187 RepID=UPI003981C221